MTALSRKSGAKIDFLSSSARANSAFLPYINNEMRRAASSSNNSPIVLHVLQTALSLLARLFVRLRYGITHHYGSPYVPRGQCGALGVNYGHSGSFTLTVTPRCENPEQASEIKIFAICYHTVMLHLNWSETIRVS